MRRLREDEERVRRAARHEVHAARADGVLDAVEVEPQLAVEDVDATYPQLEATSLLGPDAPADPVARLELVTAAITRQLIEHESELGANLRLSLKTPTPAPASQLPLRQGRAIRWIEDALAPLRMPKAALRRLVLAIRATLGIEPFVWLVDVGGLSKRDAAELMRSSARTLLAAARSSSRHS